MQKKDRVAWTVLVDDWFIVLAKAPSSKPRPPSSHLLRPWAWEVKASLLVAPKDATGQEIEMSDSFSRFDAKTFKAGLELSG